MNRNVNVFIGVILCALLCGCFVWLFSVSEEDTWKPNEIYDQLHATSYSASYTNVTYSVSSNGGLALTMSPSSALRRRAVSSYAGAYSGAASSPHRLITSSPLASSPLTYGAAPGAGLYTTSSAEIKSFGGGGNGGAAMSYSQSPIANRQSNSGLSNPSLQGGAGVGSISPIAYSTARRGDMSSATGDNPVQMMAAENPVMAMTSTAGMANGFYGGYSAMDYSSIATYSSTSDYGQYTGMFGTGRQNVRGRQNINPWDSWLSWLYDNETGNWGTGTEDENGNWIYTYTEDQLRAAYEAWAATFGQSWGPKPPSFEAWLEWMQSGGNDGYMYGDNTYRFLPVGDIVPLLLLALLYVLFVAIKSKSLKSLLKTDRSE